MADEITSTRDDYAAAFDALESDAVAPVEVTPPSVDAPAKPDAAAPETEKAGRTAGRLRDDYGRLLPGKPAKDVAAPAAPDGLPPSSTSVAPVAAAPRPARPSSWKKEMWDHWEKLDPSVAQYVLERESDYAKGVSTYKSEAERAKAVWDVITPYTPLLQQHGIDPIKHIDSLFRAHQMLATADPQSRLQMFAKLAQDYRVPLQQLIPQQDGSVQQPAVDPQMQWLAQQVESLTGKLTQYETQQQQSERQQMDANLQAFHKAPGHEHFETVRQTMAGLLQAGLAPDLEGAYQAAVRMPQHEAIFVAQQQQQREKDEAERKRQTAEATARAKANAVSTRSSAPTGAMGSGAGEKGLREHYSELLESAGGRV